ncbi:MAG: ComEC/Rec2 family competence protein [Elusimicrobia bacterium]|nr:ComEC/Rec2 family competence protein [Elusimicrobiota bacterium]
MPLSYFKRPAAVLLVLAILLLAGLKSRGFFRVSAPEELRPYLWKDGVCLGGTALSGFATKLQGDRVWFKAQEAALGCAKKEEEWLKLKRPVKVMAYLPPGDTLTPRVLPGAKARLDGRLRLPRSPANPGEFDEKAFLEERGAPLVFSARKVALAEEKIPWAKLPWAWAAQAHRSVHEYLCARFPAETAAVLEGFLLGYKGRLSPETNRAVQDAGVMHLLVPSGAKVAFVLGLAFLLGGRFGLRRALRFGAAAAIGAFYVLAVGGEPPYTRAYFCALAMMLACAFERESGAFQGLVLSALATLALRPRDLFSAGFQMTYAAVLGLQLSLPRWTLPHRWPRWVRLAAGALLASFVVQMMLWPTFAAYFGRGSLAGLFVNILLIPASGAVMLSALLSWAFWALGAAPAEALAAWAASGLAQAFLCACRFFAGLPWAAVDLAPMTPLAIAAYYLAAFGVLALPRWRASAAAWAASGALALALWAAKPKPRFEALLLSQPNGRAALLRLPDGATALLDGRIRAGLLKDVLQAEGLERFDQLWLREGAGLGRRPAKVLALAAGSEAAGSVRSIRKREGFCLGGVCAQAGAAQSGGLASVRLRHGRIQMEFGEDWVRVEEAEPSLRRLYCIMISPSGFPSSRCAAERVLSLRRDGAVRILSDGSHARIQTTKQSDPLDRDIL